METTTPAVHLDTIGQIALTVANLEEARTFYRDILGMQFLFDAGTMTFFQCGPVRLLIGAGEPGTAPAAEPSSTSASPISRPRTLLSRTKASPSCLSRIGSRA